MGKAQVLIIFICLFWSCKQPDTANVNIPKEDIPVKTEIVKEPIAKEPVKPSFKAPDGWREISSDTPGFVTDIKYATTDNFVSEVMYECGKCFLRNEAANSLFSVAAELKKKNLKIKLLDCYRPAPVQQRLWNKVPNASYVTPPWRGSQHNRGVAVDLTIVDANGEELDMGTSFDFFGEEAHHTYTGHSEEIQQNRTLLKTLMEHFGFASIRTEWWHYSIAQLKHLDVSEWEWECE